MKSLEEMVQEEHINKITDLLYGRPGFEAMRICFEHVLGESPSSLNVKETKFAEEFCEVANDWLERGTGKKEVEVLPEALSKTDEYIVRLYDSYEGRWWDHTKVLSLKEAQKIWNKETKGGTQKAKYDDGAYFAIFPSNTRMLRGDQP